MPALAPEAGTGGEDSDSYAMGVATTRGGSRDEEAEARESKSFGEASIVDVVVVVVVVISGPARGRSVGVYEKNIDFNARFIAESLEESLKTIPRTQSIFSTTHPCPRSWRTGPSLYPMNINIYTSGVGSVVLVAFRSFNCSSIISPRCIQFS